MSILPASAGRREADPARNPVASPADPLAGDGRPTRPAPAAHEPPVDRADLLETGGNGLPRPLRGAKLSRVSWAVLACLYPPATGGSRPSFAVEGSTQGDLAEALAPQTGYKGRAIQGAFAQLRRFRAISIGRGIWDNAEHVVMWGNFLAPAMHDGASADARPATADAPMTSAMAAALAGAPADAQRCAALAQVATTQPTVLQQLPSPWTSAASLPEARRHVNVDSLIEDQKFTSRPLANMDTGTVLRLLTSRGAPGSAAKCVAELVARSEADKIPPLFRHLIGAALDPSPAPIPQMPPPPPPSPESPTRPVARPATTPGAGSAPRPATPPAASQAAPGPKTTIWEEVRDLAAATADLPDEERKAIGTSQRAGSAEVRAKIQATAERVSRFVGDPFEGINYSAHMRDMRLVAAGVLTVKVIQDLLVSPADRTANNFAAAYRGAVSAHLKAHGLWSPNHRPSRPKRRRPEVSSQARSLAGAFAMA